MAGRLAAGRKASLQKTPSLREATHHITTLGGFPAREADGSPVSKPSGRASQGSPASSGVEHMRWLMGYELCGLIPARQEISDQDPLRTNENY